MQFEVLGLPVRFQLGYDMLCIDARHGLQTSASICEHRHAPAVELMKRSSAQCWPKGCSLLGTITACRSRDEHSIATFENYRIASKAHDPNTDQLCV